MPTKRILFPIFALCLLLSLPLVSAAAPAPQAEAPSDPTHSTSTSETAAPAVAGEITPVLAQPAVLPPAALAAVQPDSKGVDFWLAFPQNYNNGAPQTLFLFIAGDASTTGTVSVPGIGYSALFDVTPGSVTSVIVPNTAELSGIDAIETKGIHVTAGSEVTVYGLNRRQYTTDAFLGLPTDILGTDYIALAFPNLNVDGSEVAVVATQDGTTATITPSVTTAGHAAGVPYTVALNQGQTYQLSNTANGLDISGTIITSDKPVGVFAGHLCANCPTGSYCCCDYVVEQLPPTSTWGKSFVTMPLATRLNGDTFRFLASTDATTVSVNGTLVATLNRGQVHQQIIAGPATIVSNQPILVAQYSNSSDYDWVTSDPFMMLIPPYEQFLGSYTVTTPASGYAVNYINVVAPAAAVGAITLDGSAIPAGTFAAIGSSGFSGAQVRVALGSHILAGPLPFGAFMYGFDTYDSYGYPGGLSLAPIAQVTGLTLAPKQATNPIGTEHCVAATVTDQQGSPLVGVRVDFNVVGANPTAGFDNTDETGQAQFCYTGTMTGLDTITASVGTLSDTATKTWTGGQARIFGWTFLDANADGWREHPTDTGSGVAGVKLILTRDGVEVATALSTPEAGWYEFGLQEPGYYCVEMLTPAGYVPTSPTTVCFTLGGDDQVVDFGLEPARASIGDLVFFDTNLNGVHDAGEPGIPNVTVALWSASGGAPVAIIANTTTQADGTYLFADVAPGEYFVQVTDDHGEVAGLSLTTAGNPLGPITVVHLQSYLDADFGYNLVCPPTRGAVSGRVWLDMNADGVQDAGEPGIPDVTVYVQPLGHLATRATTTNSYGNFYACVRPGSYLVAPETDVPPLSDLVPITTEFYLPVTIKPGLGFHTAFFGYQ